MHDRQQGVKAGIENAGDHEKLKQVGGNLIHVQQVGDGHRHAAKH